VRHLAEILARFACLTLTSFVLQSAILAQTGEVTLRGQVTEQWSRASP
jgi:hypothetical protein